MHKPSIWFASSLLFTAAGAGAETFLERTVTHTIEAAGEVVEEESFRLRIEDAADVERWSRYYVALDDNRVLESLDAASKLPGGSLQQVKRGAKDTIAVPSAGELHSSAHYRQVEFPPLAPGAEIAVSHRVREAPYFAANSIPLTFGEATEKLRVEVRGGGESFRYRIDGSTAGFTVEPFAGGVRITASSLPEIEPPDFAPGEVGRGPVLRYAWGKEQSWQGVGLWYQGLTDGVPRRDGSVADTAKELLTGAAEAKDRLARLTSFVQEKVRYVAVEVGIGGYKPFPPREVLANRWGDCKAKSFLLIDLLREAGIEAYPVLIRAAGADRIDPEFASPMQFNHLIVAVPEAALTSSPSATGPPRYRFVDPTLTRGEAAWLHPSTQDQDALVIRPDRAELVRTPVSPELEAGRLSGVLTIRPDGSAGGGVALELNGSSAFSFLETLSSRPLSEVEERARRIFARLLPGATLGTISWSKSEGTAFPRVALTTNLSIASLMQGSEESRSFVLPTLNATPEPRYLAGRKEPVVLDPALEEVRLKIHLPAGWQLAEPTEQAVDNAAGAFTQRITSSGGTLLFERKTEIRQRFFDGDELLKLEELALAEHRAGKRRIRLKVGG